MTTKDKLPDDSSPIDIFGKTLDFVKQQSKEVLQSFGDHKHIILAHTDNGLEVACLVYDSDTKNDMLMTMRKRLQETKGYISINEAWYVIVDKDKVKSPVDIIPSRHPDRKEMLILYAVTKDRCRIVSIHFHKHENKIIFDDETTEDVSPENRKCNKLDAWGFDPIAFAATCG